jgi:hypothetical protein
MGSMSVVLGTLTACLMVALGVLLSSPGPYCGQHGPVVTNCSPYDCPSGQPSCDPSPGAVLPVPGSVPAIV